MADLIDHAAEARAWLENADDEYTSATPIRENAREWLQYAQVHATLALAEQQRLANIIAWTTGDGSSPIAEVRNIIAEGLGLS